MGYSGTLAMADRPDARRLLRDARDRPFDLPVVYRIDRLGRSLRALLDAHAELEALWCANPCVRVLTGQSRGLMPEQPGFRGHLHGFASRHV